jgi:hypothetical protein
VLVYDKNFTGNVLTNGYGVAFVLNKYGELTEIFCGTYATYFTVEDGQIAKEGLDVNNYSSLAWSELQEGETLVIFLNGGVDGNSDRDFALARRFDGSLGKVVTITGFTFDKAE